MSSKSCSTSSAYYLYQKTIKYHNLEIIRATTNLLSGKLKVARQLFGLTQDKLSKISGIAPATLQELENNTKNTCSRVTLQKLCDVFPEELILTEYHKFVYYQSEYLKNIDTLYLSTLFSLNPSTIERWKKGIYIVKEEYYCILKELGIL
ncbi:XRE family transcriptional regulator [Clostridium sp. HBUAS56017]|uniref:helix-turn-helix domain-containing protein n=1 Tax=Clostridium sp. HBUAS56017 TaxID=2571128 RepID=UPI0011773ED1|nr:XRE family transcriptional regulator [Clostridium sp. HBUAS56017]